MTRAECAGAWRILTGDEMRRADAATIDDVGVPGICLMETAGRHVALEVVRVLAECGAPTDAPVAVVCGRGNNGGDGFVAARHLAGWGRPVDVLTCVSPDRLTGDAATNYAAVSALGVPTRLMGDARDFSELPAPGHYAAVVDALLGTGIRGDVRGLSVEAIAWVNGHGAPVIAVDIPSGLCVDTGRRLGTVVHARSTVTFGASKAGHWLHPGPVHVGRLIIADIGIPDAVIAAQGPWRRQILGDDALAAAWPRRADDAHKSGFGHLYLLAGSAGRTGAARMAADSAMRAGVGLATIGLPGDVLNSVGGQLYEVMAEPLPQAATVESTAVALAERIDARTAAVVGPGIDTSSFFGEVIRTLMQIVSSPIVVDADALNHCAAAADPLAALRRDAPTVLTPHPGEAARLLGCTTREVQHDRLSCVRALASGTGAVCILKGAHTWVATPDGNSVDVCPDGNPGMATAGMGDVLAGVVGALLARGVPAAEAARAAVVWHARAGDVAAAARGHSALIARDVIAALDTVERAWRTRQAGENT